MKRIEYWVSKKARIVLLSKQKRAKRQEKEKEKEKEIKKKRNRVFWIWIFVGSFFVVGRWSVE